MAQRTDKLGYDQCEEFILSSRGTKLFSCTWLPKGEPKALVFLCHGYAMECSVSMKGTAIRLVEAGYAVYGIDYEGHGKSSGLQGYVRSFDSIVDDCADYFTEICERRENMGKQRFLLGESMGGAVVLFLHRKKPSFWDGAVLVAPMCKVHANPYCYKGRPRLKTAHELLMASMDVEKNLRQVSLPFIVVHGGDDVVTDPSVSRLLYESAASRDKTFRVYPGMWHALTSGEAPESIDLVFSDIITWLDSRAFERDAWLEMEAKSRHDVRLMAPKLQSLAA